MYGLCNLQRTLFTFRINMQDLLFTSLISRNHSCTSFIRLQAEGHTESPTCPQTPKARTQPHHHPAQSFTFSSTITSTQPSVPFSHSGHLHPRSRHPSTPAPILLSQDLLRHTPHPCVYTLPSQLRLTYFPTLLFLCSLELTSPPHKPSQCPNTNVDIAVPAHSLVSICFTVPISGHSSQGD
ncbi:hypothetical protein E2C01_053410 [Portunus trituberculatus]|uniref:Uncharacterized protein n=1 Tax=Portunus trituberculatus TaxID=210409 RepID=A0A5B7GH17_PORTR|nr:hypothetical protein [Portunus trituberculatus]